MKAIAHSYPLQNTTQTAAQTVVPTAAQSISTADFIYSPPPTAKTARRILVKPNLGYPVGPPVTVSMTVLSNVLEGLRKANPTAEILIVEGVCSKVSLADIAVKNGLMPLLAEGIRLLNADELECIEYPNQLPEPVRFKTMWAPKLLQEVDCRISVSAFKKTNLKGRELISASLKNLYGLFPREKYRARSPHSRGQLHRPSVPLVLQDVYFCIGHLFDGGVVDCDRKFISHDYKPDKGNSFDIGQVIWGNDLLAVDQLACEVAQERQADYLAPIATLRPPA
ncbi:DUF362 domain-containing protein [cf. Phormidesmis sp. LEGE 11477]|uniref:DUF362 domain-containing protein n=1 Tax=cf. Phormidesmis sp. LEGE 11477 TaxID=1828680 RepID=UPI001D159DD4|nr:DUF362 domain-containing protein [cf. Phormidesmis sp. LEGE 11477]